MVIRGESNIMKIYDLTTFIDLSSYDLDNEKEIEIFKNTIESFIQSGEVEAFDFEVDLIGILPESVEIEIGEERYSFEDINYLNKKVNELINEKFSENNVVCVFQANGEGYFEYEENPEIKDLKIGYTACDVESPKDVISESFCDLLLVDMVMENTKKIEMMAKNFYPKDRIIAEVYVVKKGKILEKICDIDILHFGWDEFEDIIQVEYD